MVTTLAPTRRKLRGGAAIAVAMGVMNVATYGYTVVAAHRLGTEQFGEFSSVMGVLLVVNVLSLGLQATGARRIAAEPHQVVSIERVILGVGVRSAIGLSLLCVAISPLIWGVLRLSSPVTALLVAASAAPLTVMGAQAGVLQGERRWEPLAVIYLLQGLGRVVFGVGLMMISSSAFAALLGVAVGAWLPVLVGWWALRLPRADVPHGDGHPGLDLIKEVGRSSQSLLAFFALSNADILVARAGLPHAQAGLYAGGLVLAKAILFLPQFVVVIVFPSMSQQGSRRTLMRALAVAAALGGCGLLGILLLPRLALVFVGGSAFSAISDHLWKFAVIGTLLAMIQLLVYSSLARRQGRAALCLWTALIVLVTGAFWTKHVTSLVSWVMTVDTAVFAALFLLALRSTHGAATQRTDPAVLQLER